MKADTWKLTTEIDRGISPVQHTTSYLNFDSGIPLRTLFGEYSHQHLAQDSLPENEAGNTHPRGVDMGSGLATGGREQCLQHRVGHCRQQGYRDE